MRGIRSITRRTTSLIARSFVRSFVHLGQSDWPLMTDWYEHPYGYLMTTWHTLEKLWRSLWVFQCVSPKFHSFNIWLTSIKPRTNGWSWSFFSLLNWTTKACGLTDVQDVLDIRPDFQEWLANNLRTYRERIVYGAWSCHDFRWHSAYYGYELCRRFYHCYCCCCC